MNEDNLPTYVEDSKFFLKAGLKEKLSRTVVWSKPKATGSVECAHTSEKRQSNMVAMMKKKTAPDVDIDLLTSVPVNYHYFIDMFDDAVHRKTDNPDGRLIRLITCTHDKPKKRIKKCLH